MDTKRTGTNSVKAYFNRRMEEAKAAVVEPLQPKVKLRLSAAEPPPKITLRIGQKSSHENANGVAVDSEALKRQQDLVNAGTSGKTTNVNGDVSKPLIKKPLAIAPQVPTPNQPAQDRRSGSAPRPESSNGVKNETQQTQSPATMLRHGSTASNEATQSPHLAAINMPPPSSLTPRLPSGSPHPQAYHAPNHTHAANPLDSRWRQPGKGKFSFPEASLTDLLTYVDASDALISNLTIATHPMLKLDRHFHLDIPPSPTATQQSVTITLPATHYFLQITPTVASNVLNRQSRIFVTVNNQRLMSTQLRAESQDARRSLYDARLIPGINRVEVEIIAGPARGAPKIGQGLDIELEKVTVFVNLVN